MKDHLEIIEARGRPQADVLRLRGPLDARNASILLERCDAIRDAGRHLILGLGEVTLLSSSGIGALLALNEDFKGKGLALRLANPSPIVRTAIDLLNLATFLHLVETEEEALRQLAA